MSGAAGATNAARFTLGEVLYATGGVLRRGGADLATCGVTTDSRALAPGALFIALGGERFDGHDFLAQVYEAGCAAAIVDATKTSAVPLELPYLEVLDTLRALGDLARSHRHRFAVPVVAVTGSYGKTTTRALITAALQAQLNVLATAGNFNNEIGLPQTLFQLEAGHQAAVVEMGMRGAGQIAYLAAIAEPTVGVITNIGPQHIELLGTLENIAAAKAELLEALPADGLAVLPADDVFLPYLRGKSPCRVVTYGDSEIADYNVHCYEATGEGGTFVVNAGGLEATVTLAMPGRHNAVNAAAAIAVAVESGVPLGKAVAALAEAQAPGARMRVLHTESYTIIDDCYNAGPNSMRAALAVLRDQPGTGRRVAILGSMKELGDFAPEAHRAVGALAGEFVDVVVAVGEEAREYLPAAGACSQTVWHADAASAAQAVPDLLQPGDIVLVKGSRSIGLEMVVSALAGR